MRIKQVELTDYGIEHSQNFQGHGTSFTFFDDSATGIGDTAAEAINDALECAAGGDFDSQILEAMLLASLNVGAIDQLPETETIEDYLRRENPDEWFDESGEFDGAECELHYHVGLSWSYADDSPGFMGPPELSQEQVDHITVRLIDFPQVDALYIEPGRPILYHAYPHLDSWRRIGRDHPQIAEALALWPVAQNLDGIFPDDLREIAADVEAPQSYREYAALKFCAMQCRGAGLIQAALAWETACEQVYSTMPIALRW